MLLPLLKTQSSRWQKIVAPGEQGEPLRRPPLSVPGTLFSSRRLGIFLLITALRRSMASAGWLPHQPQPL
jgi:hypothetical protein